MVGCAQTPAEFQADLRDEPDSDSEDFDEGDEKWPVTDFPGNIPWQDNDTTPLPGADGLSSANVSQPSTGNANWSRYTTFGYQMAMNFSGFIVDNSKSCEETSKDGVQEKVSTQMRRGIGRRGRGRPSFPGPVSEMNRGERLVEIYPKDEDIPLELRERLQTREKERLAQEKYIYDRRKKDESVDDVVDDECEAIKDYRSFSEDVSACLFDWKSMDSFQGTREAFSFEKSGPNQRFESGYQAFRAIWPDDFLLHIVTETNRYASSISQTDSSFHINWYDTNVHEILILFAFWMMFSIIRMPTVNSCFSLNPLLKTDVFRRLFREKRYWILNRALFFANPVGGDSDELHLIRPVIQHLNAKFQQLYVPYQNICISEPMTLWKGHLGIRQTKSKVTKFEVKSYELSESLTGYLWSFYIDASKATASEDSLLQKSIEIVLKLMQPLLGKGFTLFADSWLNSPLLARFLKRNRTDCFGQLRRNRRDVPALLVEQTLREGSFMARHADNVVVVTLQDKMPVFAISTYHGIDQNVSVETSNRPSVYKLTSLSDYNGTKDQTLEPHLTERKQTSKWYKNIFKRFLNLPIQNSRILLKHSTEKRLNNVGFQLELVGEIMTEHLHLVPRTPQVRSATVSRVGLSPSRFVCGPTQFHSLRRIVVNCDVLNRRTTAKGQSLGMVSCVWCKVRNSKRSRTVYECKLCETPLCLEPCFELFHTSP